MPVISFSERKKKEDVCSFLKKIKKKFKRKKKVYIILDNFSSHKAKDAKKTAEELGLELVLYLPTNSPHLNPIERRLFANMQKEAINGSNFEDVREVIRVVTDYVEYYNNERKTTTMMKETVEKIKIPSS